MATEIERKFLVKNDSWRAGAVGIAFRQGYLCAEPERTVRVRLEGGLGKLTVKGKSVGISRAEYDYVIPADDAIEMLDRLCLRPLIEKTRYRIEHAGQVWDVDVFHSENSGLILAEIELESVDSLFALPDWVGAEVSADPRYFNSNLVKRPFSGW
ncbi:MAG TPA: CYTH domain-containing protein [Malonomonas sp.]